MRGLLAAATVLLMSARPLAAEPVFDAIPLPVEAKSLPADFAASSSTTKHAKIDSALVRLARGAGDEGNGAIVDVPPDLFRIVGDRVQVEIATHDEGTSSVIEVITDAGGEVTGAGYNGTLVQAWLPPAALELVAANSDVHMIRPPARAWVPDSDTNSGHGWSSGTAATEALDVMGAAAWHAAGYRGTGARVGIIDLDLSTMPTRTPTATRSPTRTPTRTKTPTPTPTIAFCSGDCESARGDAERSLRHGVRLIFDPSLLGFTSGVGRRLLWEPCYGWTELDPGHGFHANERGQTRFTISPSARRGILRLLLALNLEIAAAESHAGGRR